MKIKKREEESDEDIYTESGVQSIFDNDAISIEEEGFMIGYLCA